MILKRVSIAGADQTCRIEDLFALSREFPFVEWGILIKSSGSNPTHRYPELNWIDELCRKNREAATPMNLSLHVCGGIIKDIFKRGDKLWQFFCGEPKKNKGYETRVTNMDETLRSFQRIQLNFTAADHRKYSADMAPALLELPGEHQFIIQALAPEFDPTGENVTTGWTLRDAGVDVVFLHDASAGHGVATQDWLEPIGDFCGYAGGLNPENLEENLELIEIVAGDTPIWADMESGVRDENDLFVLDRVQKVLEIAKPWIKD
ncbi:MAG: hypothetical protein IJF84_10065 [Thermoguttaceae bacterium]|nr:hypothetical protein [Thermoguttaceae bacterium]